MEEQTAMQKNNYRVFRSAAFGIMCFLTLFCIVSDIRNDIFRDSYTTVAGLVYLLGLVILTLLFRAVFSKKTEITRPMLYYMVFLLDIHIAAFFSALSLIFYQIPGHAGITTVLLTLSYFFTMIIYYTLWLYQKQFLKESAVTRAVTVLILIALLIYTAVLMINMFRPVIFQITYEGSLSRSVTDYVSVITGLFCLLLLCIATFSSDLSMNLKFSFLCCIFAPTLFGTLSVNEALMSWGIYICGILSLSVMLPLCLLFFNVHDELEKDILKKEKEQTRLRISAMISQMQPHFLYNSLAVIAALCEEDPKLAAEATSEFSNYLRENMDFADKSNPVSFSEELNHIKTYVWLEKLRFPAKLNIEYDTAFTAFPVPALSVQPIVENAIKHGICKSRTGGTVRISSFEADQYYCVTVCDNGIGFDLQNMADDSRQHLGINNTRYRIKEMMGGSLDIESSPGKGTKVTIKIPK